MTEVKQFKADINVNSIELTERAKSHVLNYLIKNTKKGFRLSTKKTGCSGLSYVLDYLDDVPEDDIIIPLENNYIIAMDKNSYPYLKNIKIDYIKEGLNYKFVFNNPNQTGQCGCGESFTVDDF